MNKTVVAFALSTIGLTATTLYYAHELGELRSADPPAAAATTQQPANAGSGSKARAAPPAGTAASAPAVVADASPGSTGASSSSNVRSESRRAQAVAESAQFLARYNDPAQRQAMLNGSMRSWRERLRRVRDAADLSGEQWDALVQLRVDERFDRKRRYSQCLVDPACRMPAPAPAELEERSRKLAEDIGEKNMSLVRSEERRGPEVRVVEKLQTRLPPDLKMSRDAQEALIDALGDECQQALREMEVGGRITSYWGDHGIIGFVKDVPTLEENLEIVRRFSSRMSDRAATLLNTERMETFNILQDDGVMTFRASMRRRLTLRAAGYDGN